MGKIRKAIASLSVVAILSTLIVTATASAQTFGDVPSDHPEASFIEGLVDIGAVTIKDRFNPSDNVQRDEALKLALLANGHDVAEGDANCAGNPFTDANAPTYWGCSFVGYGYSAGIVKGMSPTMFNPSGDVSRSQMAKMALLSAGYTVDEDAACTSTFSDAQGHWSCPYLNKGAELGWWSGFGDGTYHPDEPMIRSHTAKLAYNSSQGEAPAPDEEVPSEEVPGEEPSGDLDVSLNADSPDGDTVPSNATSVVVAMWDFDATVGGAALDSLQVHTYGVTDLPTGHALYLYNGNERLTSGKSVNSTTNLATFNNLGLDIEEADTLTLSLRVDVGTAEASSEMAFEIADAGAVGAGDASIGGSFPIRADKFSISMTAAGTMTVEKNGAVTNPKVGEDDVTIAKFKMSATNEAGSLEEFGLYLAGTIASDAVENFELYVSGMDDPIATVAGLNSKDIAQFVLDTPFEIAKGDSKAFWVKADLNTGRAGDTVLAYVDETTDVLAVGDTYGFGMSVDLDNAGGYDGTACSGAFADCTNSTVEGGDITVSSSGPAATDIAIAGDDVVLMNFTVATIAQTTFKNFPVSLTASESADTTEGLMNATASNLTDIKITNVDTGETLMGPIDADVLTTAIGGATAITEAAGDAAQAFYLFTDEFDMAPGEELNLAITADVANTATLDAMTVSSTLELGASYPEMRDTNNKVVTNSSTLVPASAITGKTMTVSSPSLDLALAAVPVTTTKVKGESAVKFVGISAKCGSASDCKVTDVALTGYIDDSGATTFVAGQDTVNNNVYVNEIVGSVWLEDGQGNTIAASKSVQSNGTVTYSSLDWTIGAGDTEIFYIAGNISSNAYKNGNGESISFAIAAAGASYEDDDGNTRNSAGAVNGTTAPTTYVIVSGGGSLTVAVDADTTKEDIVVAGTSDNEISKFKFTTTDEAFKVKKLSINARQSAAITAAALGDYDNNVSSITISYPNSNGDTETKTGFLTNGTAQFSGMDLFIDKDDDAVMTVSANINTISLGATAAEFVDLNVGFNNFEAVAQASGETYKADKIDGTVAAASDLDFGPITWVDGDESVDLDGVQDPTVTLGGSTTLTVDANGAGDNTNKLPVGALICVDDDNSGACTTEDIYVVTAWPSSTAGSEDSVIVTMIDDAGDDSYDDNDPLLYTLPGNGYLANAKQMHVYEAQPVVTLAASSPSGSRTVSASDNAFVFSIAENGGLEKIQVRAGTVLTTSDGFDSAGANNAALAADTDTGDQLDGSSTFAALDNYLATDSVSMLSAVDLSNYGRVNFWIKYTAVVDGLNPANVPPIANVSYNVTASATLDPTADDVLLSAAACGADGTSFVTTEWYNCDVDISTMNAVADTFFHIIIANSAGLFFVSDELHLDRVMAYNEKLVVDIASDGDLDTYANNTSNAAAPSEAYLKQGGSTVATGYWNTATNGASATSSGNITFIPTSDIDVSKGTSKTFTLQVDSSDLLAEDAGSDDPVTLSIDMGTSTDGTVTEGDFWWAETNALVKWTGQVENTILNGNTLTY